VRHQATYRTVHRQHRIQRRLAQLRDLRQGMGIAVHGGGFSTNHEEQVKEEAHAVTCEYPGQLGHTKMHCTATHIVRLAGTIGVRPDASDKRVVVQVRAALNVKINAEDHVLAYDFGPITIALTRQVPHCQTAAWSYCHPGKGSRSHRPKLLLVRQSGSRPRHPRRQGRW
jgi:hypothetical protein